MLRFLDSHPPRKGSARTADFWLLPPSSELRQCASSFNEFPGNLFLAEFSVFLEVAIRVSQTVYFLREE